jgi:hypothetical protein
MQELFNSALSDSFDLTRFGRSMIRDAIASFFHPLTLSEATPRALARLAEPNPGRFGGRRFAQYVSTTETRAADFRQYSPRGGMMIFGSEFP